MGKCGRAMKCDREKSGSGGGGEGGGRRIRSKCTDEGVKK